MPLLLDTQVIIWMEGDESKIPDNTKSKILKEPDLLISKVSVWEMAIKLKIKKLSLKTPLQTFIGNFLEGYSCKMMDIGLNHIYYTQRLPFHHRDPFDRLLIAQSLVDNISIVTSDVTFDDYKVHRIWTKG